MSKNPAVVKKTSQIKQLGGANRQQLFLEQVA
jgi:hypothetical protein